MGQIDSKIIEAVVRPEGVTEAELQEINPDFRAHLDALKKHGMHLFGKTIEGVTVYSTVEILDAPPAPAPPSAAAPLAEAPRSIPQTGEPTEKPPDIDYDARLTVDTFKVRSREGRPPVIEMIPTGPIGAQVATLFSMQKPKKAIVMIYLKIIGESAGAEKTAPQGRNEQPPAEQPEPHPDTASPEGEASGTIIGAPAAEGGDDVVEPKDYNTIQINPTPKAHEKQPEAKPKEQIAREIEQQISNGELSPAAADAMAKLGGL